MKQIKTAILISMLAGLSMGNESCQQAQTRVLKMDVNLGSIGAQSVLMPSGEKIDFGYVANSLFYQEVNANDHFVIMNSIPTPTSSGATQTGLVARVAGKLGLGKTNDQLVMEKYGYADQLLQKSTLVANRSETVGGNAADVPACLYNMPQAQLTGEVVSFEANFGAGLSIGYGTNGVLSSTTPVGGSVNFTSTRLQLGLRAVDPLSGQLEAAATGVSNQSNVNFAANLASALLGINFMYNTPIASVVSSGFDKALSAVETDMIAQHSTTGSWGDAWESRVVYDPQVVDGDETIMFRGGTRYGMVVGDQFTITNMAYNWAGAPCQSALVYKVPTTPTPVANVTVIAVGDNVAVAKVDKYLIDNKILPGAQVKLLQMYVAAANNQSGK